MSAPLRLPLDPRELAKLPAPERGRIYRELGLHRVDVACAEEAVREVLRQRYARRTAA